MDEMKIALRTKLMRKTVSKMIEGFVYRKFGIKSNISINDIEIEKVNDEICFHIDAGAKINENDFVKIISKKESV